MGFLERLFRGDAVSDEDYEAENDELEAEAQRAGSVPRNNVVEFQSRTPGTKKIDRSFTSTSAQTQFESDSDESVRPKLASAYVVLKRLQGFTQSVEVAERLVEGKIVILNLESCDDDHARRALDFIGGAAYACKSEVKRIAGRVFMITPKGVSADGEFFDEVRSASQIRYEED